MKLKHCSIIILLGLSYSCGINWGENGKKEVTGIVYDTFEGEKIFAELSEFSIGGRPVKINDEGEFEINIQPGEYHLRIRSQYFHNLDSTIVIGEKTNNVDIKVKSLLDNYYSFYVGKVWSFKYSSGDRSYGITTRETTSTIDFEIVKEIVSSTENDTTYIAQVQINGTEVRTDDYTGESTTDSVQKSGTLTILVSGETVTYSSIPTVEYFDFNKIRGAYFEGDYVNFDSDNFIFHDGLSIPLKHKYPKAVSKGRKINAYYHYYSPPVFITLTPGKGISEFYYFDGGHHYWWESFSLAN